MKTYIRVLAGAILSGSVLWGCGSNSSDGASTTEIDSSSRQTDPVDYSALNLTDKQIDSIAVYRLDFLSPGEGVGLLYYYYGVADRSKSVTESDQVKRKFKDIYDILSGIHGSNFVAAIEKLTKQRGVNLTTVYEKYSGQFENADDGGTVVSEPAPADSVAAAPIAPENITDAEVVEENGLIIVNPNADPDTRQ